MAENNPWKSNVEQGKSDKPLDLKTDETASSEFEPEEYEEDDIDDSAEDRWGAEKIKGTAHNPKTGQQSGNNPGAGQQWNPPGTDQPNER